MVSLRLMLGAVIACSVAGCVQIKPKNTFEWLSPDVHAPERSWTPAQAASDIAGKTFVRHTPGKGHQVIYFSPDHTAYAWETGVSYVKSATWVTDSRSPTTSMSATTVICMMWPTYDLNGKAVSGPTKTQCIQSALLHIPAVSSAQGDVFGLAQKTTAPFELPVDKKTVSDLKLMQ